MSAAQIAFLPDGRRLHLQHGPIDLIVDVTGPDRDTALRQAATRFETVLDELVPELDLLRRAAGPQTALQGAIARRMHRAVAPFAQDFVTPMAAVAGAVADTVLAAAVQGTKLDTAYVNNGGDVAFFLAPGQAMTAAVAAGKHDRLTIASDDPVRGVATSGWRGRSYSLGIADGVTVLAESAAAADAAATLIANRVDLPGSQKITRCPAHDLSPDSDLGDRAVTVDVAPLSPNEIADALERGHRFAASCAQRGLICAALLTLSGQSRIAGNPGLLGQTLKDVDYA